jgi:hypothetical protein
VIVVLSGKREFWRYLASKQLTSQAYTSGHAPEMFDLLGRAESSQVLQRRLPKPTVHASQ